MHFPVIVSQVPVSWHASGGHAMGLALLHMPVDGSQTPAWWHAAGAGHVTGLCPTHTPAWQESVCVQRFPSLHGVPSATLGVEHCPVAASQVPAPWHWSIGAHALATPAVQTPAWQVSFTVQPLPSSHAVPLGLGVLEHSPVDALHALARWHWSATGQTVGVGFLPAGKADFFQQLASATMRFLALQAD